MRFNLKDRIEQKGLTFRDDLREPATCPKCGNTWETIFYGPELVCRNHPEHPLYRGAAA